jgi:tripartite ATP-independent transporter DctM subunit
MEVVDLLPFFMFGALLLLIMAGYPVAFTLAGTAILFGWIGHGLDVFDISDFSFIPMRIWGIMNNFTLVAVPLFIFMGITLEVSKISEDLLESVSKIFGHGRSQMAISVILVGALLAASTGIVGATVVTMGVLSLPSMLAKGYSKELACGTVAASGTLGQIIPPSIVLILLGDIMNVDVGDLFIGALLPGLLLVLLYVAYVFFASRKSDLPEVSTHSESNDFIYFLKALVPPLSLMVVVLGSILCGLASPTEAASCGALGALLIAKTKKRLSYDTLKQIMEKTAVMSAMVFTILIGAQFFGIVFRGLGGDEQIIQFVESLGLNPPLVLLVVMVLIFILGFFLDFLEICFIVIPVFLPVMTTLGFDPLWIAVLIAVNLQTSFLTPPFGFALFYLKGVAPKGILTSHIYRGIIPYVFIQVVAVLMIAMIPGLVTWLPKVVFGN